MCNDKKIKELLPAYGAQTLDRTEKLMIESHLKSCDDCRIEVSLLRIMADDAAPDPGEAFWAAMPDHVYQAVQKNDRRERKAFDLSRVLDWMTLPRWTWAAATVGTVLIISWEGYRI